MTERVVIGGGVLVAAGLTAVTMGRATGMLVVALLVSYALWLTRSRWPVARQIIPVYAFAVLIQCAHFAEEYGSGFHRLFPPIFGAEPWSDRRFLIFNLIWLAVFVSAAVGLLLGSRVAYLVALFLGIGGGIGNGLGHLALSARERGYFPGVYTGILALLAGTALTYRLVATRPEA